jgi:hypothetical protein
MLSDDKEDALKSCEADMARRNREHLKRKAKVMRNSRYDDHSFLVDYSGIRNKCLKQSDLQLRALSSEPASYCHPQSGQTTEGKVTDSVLGKASKRILKMAKKQ